MFSFHKIKMVRLSYILQSLLSAPDQSIFLSISSPILSFDSGTKNITLVRAKNHKTSAQDTPTSSSRLKPEALEN